MKFAHILGRLRSARWAIRPAHLQAIYDSLGAHLRVGPASGRQNSARRAEMNDDLENSSPGTAAAPEQPSAPVCVIPVYGIIGKHLSSLETMCGGCDVDCIEGCIEAALADPAVQAIVLDFDSPGGTVTGVPELAAKIREWKAQKPIYGFTSSLCASAAYWIASACTSVFTTMSADMGSIGVYIAMCDDSEWWKKEGYKLELIKAGEFKAMGISGQPLSDAERAMLQADVDTIYKMFTADVRAGRGNVDDAVMQGQTFLGQDAVAANLADSVIPDLETLTSTLTKALTAAPALTRPSTDA